MKLKMRSVVLGLSTLLASSISFAATYHMLERARSIDYELAVNDPQTFANPFFNPIKASCEITSESNMNAIEVAMLKKTGVVNNTKLSAGDLVTINVQSGDKLIITANPGSEVRLTNMGNVTVKAHCSTI